MDKEFIMATAKTIEQQILWSINKWEYLSWGIRQKAAIEYEGMATLALRVSGAVHKGWVFVSLNEGKDCYEVRLLNVARTKVKRTLEEVYCDNLGEVLDSLIERKSEWTDAQYKDKAVRDSARKMGMEVIDVSKNNSSNNKPTNKEDKTMRLNINNNSETKNVQNNAQVNNNSNAAVMHEVDVIGLMGSLYRDGHAKLSDHATPVVPDAAPVEDAQAEEVESVNVGEVTVDSIMPVMQPVESEERRVKSEESATPEKPAVTVPLSEHGTLVVGGVGSDKPKPEMPKRDKNGKFLKKSEDKPKVQDSVPQTSASYRVVLVPSKDGSGQWPKLYGFQSEADAEKMTKKMAKSIRNSWDRDEQGEKRFYIKGGKKYCDVFQELCNALNAGDKAAIDKACKRTVAIYDGAVADGKAESAAKKAEREAAKAQEKPAKPSGKAEKPATGYSDQDVADMLRKVMAGGDVPENIKKLLQAA